MTKQGLEEQSEEKNGASVHTRKKPLVTKWRVIGSALFAGLLAWIPFFGYTYLIAKLYALGFSGVDVNPKAYDLVVLALEGFTRPLVKGIGFIESDVWLTVFKETFKYAVILFGLFLVFSISFRFFKWRNNNKIKKEKRDKNVTESAIESILESVFIKSSENIIGFFTSAATAIALAFFSVGVWLFSGFVLFTMAIVFWLLAMLGQMAGWADASDINKEKICTERIVSTEDNRPVYSDKEIKNGFALSCAKIEIEGEIVSGHRIFSDQYSTFFITNDGAFQVSTTGKILYQRIITRIDNDEVVTP